MNTGLDQFSDQRQQVAFEVVRATLWVVLVTSCGSLLFFAFSDPPSGADLHARQIRVGMSMLVPLAAGIGLALLSRRLLVPAVALFASILYLVPMTSAVGLGLGVHAIGMALWPVVVMLLGFAWGKLAAIGAALVFVASIVGLMLAQLGGWLPGPSMATLGGPVLFATILFLLVVLICWLTVRYSGIFFAALAAAVNSRKDLERSNLALQRSEETLQARNRQFEAILTATTESIFHVDREGVILAINATAAHRIKMEPDELIGKCVFDFFPPDVAARRRADMNEVLASGRTKYAEDMRDGRFFAVHYYPVSGPSGGTESLVVFALDVTERHKVQQRLAQNEERMELAIAGADLGLWDLDIPSGIFTHNPRLLTMIGYEPGEIEATARTFVSLLHPDDAARFAADFYAHLKGETPNFEAEYRVRHKDGHWVWILSRGKVVQRNQEGRAVRLTGTNRDISEGKRSEAALKAREARLSTLIASMQDLVFVLDTGGTVVEYFLPSMSRSGAHPPREAVLHKAYAEILPADVARLYDVAIAGVMADGKPRTFEYAMSIDGRESVSFASMSPMAGETGCPTGFLVVVRDITSERASLRELERLSRSNTLLLESVGEGIYGIDLDSRASFVNSSALVMLGYTEEEVLGQEPHALFHHRRKDGTPYPVGECPIRWTMQDGQIRRVEDEWFWRKDGNSFPVAMTVTPIVENDQRVGVVVIFQDITERKASEAMISDLAFYDPLTRLPNRRLLLDRLAQAMAASQRSACHSALMFIDLDNFKPLNDAHGHGLGDLLLVEVAHRLKRCVREADTVARFGGDEFVVMLGELSADRASATAHAEIVAEKICRDLAATYLLTVKHVDAADTTVEHRCTASIGVTLFVSHEVSQDAILMQADHAMYAAKEAGRNGFRFASSTPPAVSETQGVAPDFMQFAWRPAFQCGNALIDEQHRALLSGANQLLAASLARRNREELVALMDGLMLKVAGHFRDEESILAASGFAGAADHAAMHQKLVERAGELVGRFRAGTPDSGELFAFLADDLIARHILETDRKYFPHLAQRELEAQRAAED